MDKEEVPGKMRFIELLVLSGSLIFTIGDFESKSTAVTFSMFLVGSIAYFGLLLHNSELKNKKNMNLIYSCLAGITGFFYAILIGLLTSIGPETLGLKLTTGILYTLIFTAIISLSLMPQNYSKRVIRLFS